MGNFAGGMLDPPARQGDTVKRREGDILIILHAELGRGNAVHGNRMENQKTLDGNEDSGYREISQEDRNKDDFELVHEVLVRPGLIPCEFNGMLLPSSRRKHGS